MTSSSAVSFAALSSVGCSSVRSFFSPSTRTLVCVSFVRPPDRRDDFMKFALRASASIDWYRLISSMYEVGVV